MIIFGEKVLLKAGGKEVNQLVLALINDPDAKMMLGERSWPVSETEQPKWV